MGEGGREGEGSGGVEGEVAVAMEAGRLAEGGERWRAGVSALRAALAAGKRAYWICPLVEESDKLDIAAAEERFASLVRALPTHKVALAHGKMKAPDRAGFN